jgi:acetyl esterase/lipase
MMKLKTIVIIFTLISLLCLTPFGACKSADYHGLVPVAKLGTVDYDITYATIEDTALMMDIHYPRTATGTVPAIIYVHGGGWTSGDKESGAGVQFIPELVSRGYLVAAINYRLAPECKVIDQIGDVKCAVRYLRAKAADYGIDTHRIGVIGGSAGGHLVTLLGTSDKSSNLEGNGGYYDQSSRVQAVVDLFGPADLVTMFESTSPQWLQNVFGTPNYNSDDIKRVSPVTYITSDDPPFLILQGDQDTVVPQEQSEILFRKLKEANVPASLVIVKNAGHGFRPVPITAIISPSEQEMTLMIADFFDRYLKE